jgi:hypothetical protein
LSTRAQRCRYTIDLDWNREVDGIATNSLIRIENALSITVSHGFDQDISIATVIVPYPLDERITLRMSGRVYLGTSDTVFAFEHWYQRKRFDGFITEIDRSFAPGTAAITFSDKLVVAQYVYPRNVLSRQLDPSWPSEDFAGLTDQEVVVAVLDDCQFFAEPALIGGTGQVMSPDPLIWPEEESAFEVIQEIDAWAFLADGSGYRTFVTANGDLVRQLLTPLPPADATPDFVFTEGVDIFDAGRQHAVPAPAGAGTLTAASEVLDPATPPAWVSNPFYDPYTDHPSEQRATLTTYREDLFPPNSVVAITSDRLGSTATYLFWLQAVTTARDEQGAFTQQLQMIIGPRCPGPRRPTRTRSRPSSAGRPSRPSSSTPIPATTAIPSMTSGSTPRRSPPICRSPDAGGTASSATSAPGDRRPAARPSCPRRRRAARSRSSRPAAPGRPASPSPASR